MTSPSLSLGEDLGLMLSLPGSPPQSEHRQAAAAQQPAPISPRALYARPRIGTAAEVAAAPATGAAGAAILAVPRELYGNKRPAPTRPSPRVSTPEQPTQQPTQAVHPNTATPRATAAPSSATPVHTHTSALVTTVNGSGSGRKPGSAQRRPLRALIADVARELHLDARSPPSTLAREAMVQVGIEEGAVRRSLIERISLVAEELGIPTERDPE